MQVTFNGKSAPLTEKEREYAQKRLQRLARYFQSARVATLAHSVLRGQHTVEVTLDLDGTLLRAESRAGELTEAVDQVTDKLEQQVRRLKDRLRSHRGRADAPTVAALLSENLANGGESDSPADAPSLPDVVRRKRFAIKPMTAEEASLQMELLNHDFFAFQDASSGQVHILYHRQDGNYGLLELEI